MLVSILIPCYNAASYIEQTLKSVIAQTYTNWECIVVDDQSTDNSRNLINTYCNKFPGKIKLFSNAGKGACAARNFGLEMSKGKYIQYLDADDLLSPTKIRNQIVDLSQKKDSVAFCKWGRFINEPDNVVWSSQLINKDYNTPHELLLDLWLGKGMAQTSVWLTPRHLIEAAGEWNENLRINQDGEFFSRVIINAKNLIFTEEAGVYYRSDNMNSIGKQRSEPAMLSQLHSYQLYKETVDNYSNETTIKKKLYKGIAAQLSDFYIRNKTQYPDLAKQAKEVVQTLGLKLSPEGGRHFKFVSSLIGIDSSIALREMLRKFK